MKPKPKTTPRRRRGDESSLSQPSLSASGGEGQGEVVHSAGHPADCLCARCEKKAATKVGSAVPADRSPSDSEIINTLADWRLTLIDSHSPVVAITRGKRKLAPLTDPKILREIACLEAAIQIIGSTVPSSKHGLVRTEKARADSALECGRKSSPPPLWISIRDQFPPCTRAVLVLTKLGLCYVARYHRHGLWLDDSGDPIHVRITHWMPLPEPPPPTQNSKLKTQN